ncbi:uncharacterized protein LOC114575650 [Exaiptasia diaphana]|uniref:Uncharacterized protein n=1 Tax=Exaiptasia diaphana TaxID=2652724 RepID=A0A913YRK3_EXADI|nr:uncharacterized protein LOC114575650 [Exaiptasia diaphana]
MKLALVLFEMFLILISTLVLILVITSVVVLLRSEKTLLQEDQGSLPSYLTGLCDNSLKREVLGNEDDPAQGPFVNFNHIRVCAGILVKCLKTSFGKCAAVPFCKAMYFRCRCILKDVRRCRKILGFANKIKKHSSDLKKVDQDEGRDRDANKAKCRKILKAFQRGYKKCAHGKEDCGPCLEQSELCIAKKKHYGKHEEPLESEKEMAMPNKIVNHADNEEDAKQREVIMPKPQW